MTLYSKYLEKCYKIYSFKKEEETNYFLGLFYKNNFSFRCFEVNW